MTDRERAHLERCVAWLVASAGERDRYHPSDREWHRWNAAVGLFRDDVARLAVRHLHERRVR